MCGQAVPEELFDFGEDIPAIKECGFENVPVNQQCFYIRRGEGFVKLLDSDVLPESTAAAGGDVNKMRALRRNLFKKAPDRFSQGPYSYGEQSFISDTEADRVEQDEQQIHFDSVKLPTKRSKSMLTHYHHPLYARMSSVVNRHSKVL